MGNKFSQRKPKKHYNILCLGIDGAGKTAILHQLKLGQDIATVPTLGFNVEELIHNKCNFTVWDVGGQISIRPLWRYYLEDLDGLVYVIDSQDVDRLLEARAELQCLLEHNEKLKRVPLLILANKQDLPGSLTPCEIKDCMRLDVLLKRYRWRIESSIAPTGVGLFEGLDWLDYIIERRNTKKRKASKKSNPEPENGQRSRSNKRTRSSRDRRQRSSRDHERNREPHRMMN